MCFSRRAVSANEIINNHQSSIQIENLIDLIDWLIDWFLLANGGWPAHKQQTFHSLIERKVKLIVVGQPGLTALIPSFSFIHFFINHQFINKVEWNWLGWLKEIEFAEWEWLAPPPAFIKNQRFLNNGWARCPSFLFISQSIFPLGREDWWKWKKWMGRAVQPSSSIIKQINFTLLNCFIV